MSRSSCQTEGSNWRRTVQEDLGSEEESTETAVRKQRATALHHYRAVWNPHTQFRKLPEPSISLNPKCHALITPQLHWKILACNPRPLKPGKTAELCRSRLLLAFQFSLLNDIFIPGMPRTNTHIYMSAIWAYNFSSFEKNWPGYE